MVSQIIDAKAFFDQSTKELKAYVDDVVQDVMEGLLQTVCCEEDPLFGEDEPSSEMAVQSVELTFDRGTIASVSDNVLAGGDAQTMDMDIVSVKGEDPLPDDELAGGDEQVKSMDMMPVRGEEVRITFGDLVGWLSTGRDHAATHRYSLSKIFNGVENESGELCGL
jgi:hypothetical protein